MKQELQVGGPELDLLPPARPLTEATNSGLQAVQVERAFELSGSTEDRFFQSMPSSGASFPVQLSVEKWHRARRGAGGARGREQEISLGSRSPTHTRLVQPGSCKKVEPACKDVPHGPRPATKPFQTLTAAR